MKALVLVDDNPDHTDLLQLAVRQRGLAMPVRVFDSGNACLAGLGEGRIVVGMVVLDVNMPGLPGAATCRLIHAIEGMAAVPVVMLSSGDCGDDRRRALEAGAVDYLLKPQDGRSWRDVLDELMRYWPRDGVPC
jgi:DNA-binding response OmpR family regulator